VTDECGCNTRSHIIERKEYIEVFTAFLSVIIDECEEKSLASIKSNINWYLGICNEFFGDKSEIVNCFKLLLSMQMTIIDSYDHRKKSGFPRKDDLFGKVDSLLDGLSKTFADRVNSVVDSVLKELKSVKSKLKKGEFRSPFLLAKVDEEARKILGEEIEIVNRGLRNAWVIKDEALYQQVVVAFLSKIIDECEEKTREKIANFIESYVDIFTSFHIDGFNCNLRHAFCLLCLLCDLKYKVSNYQKINTKIIKEDLLREVDLLLEGLNF